MESEVWRRGSLAFTAPRYEFSLLSILWIVFFFCFSYVCAKFQADKAMEMTRTSSFAFDFLFSARQTPFSWLFV